MSNDGEPNTALFLCDCGHWQGEHTPAGACRVCDCSGFEAAEGVEHRARLGEMLVYLPAPHTLRIEFSRPLAQNRGSVRIAGVEAIGLSAGVLFVCVEGALEAMIPIERIAYVAGEIEGTPPEGT